MTIIDRYQNCLIWNHGIHETFFIHPVLKDEAKKRRKPTVSSLMIKEYKLYRLSDSDRNAMLVHFQKFHKLVLVGNLENRYVTCFTKSDYLQKTECHIGKDYLTIVGYYISNRTSDRMLKKNT